MENVVIDTPERIDDDIEEFKLKATIDDEKNYTANKIKLCRDGDEGKPLLFYTQELSRNFRDPQDQFGKRHIIKVFTPSNFEASVDTALERKFNDTILAHKERIEDYSPLSDIHSERMNLFMDEDTATFLDDIGVNVDGFGEDFQGMESVGATPFMEEVAADAGKIKRQLAGLRSKYVLVKEQMADEFEEYLDPRSVSDEDFDERLSREKISEGLVQTYLALKEQINQLEAQLGEVSKAVFQETSSRIRLPGVIKEKEENDGLFTL
ncbi:MAG: hypothetical protein V3T99_00355 [Nitrososphaerales archaeon]